MFSPLEFFLLIRIHMGSRNKSSLAAQAAILGNFFNLHKCKMAAARYVNMCYTRTARKFFIPSMIAGTLAVIGCDSLLLYARISLDKDLSC